MQLLCADKVVQLFAVPSPPENVKLSLQGPVAVRVQWQEPREKNGAILSYIIRYSTDESFPFADWEIKRQNGENSVSRIGYKELP